VLHEQAARGLIVSVEELLESFPTYDKDRQRRVLAWLETRPETAPFHGGTSHPEALFLAHHLPAVEAWLKAHSEHVEPLERKATLAAEQLPAFESRARQLLGFLREGPVHVSELALARRAQDELADARKPLPEWDVETWKDCYSALWWLGSAAVAGEGRPELLRDFDLVLAGRRYAWSHTDHTYSGLRHLRDRAYCLMAVAGVLQPQDVLRWADETDEGPEQLVSAIRVRRVIYWTRGARSLLAGRAFDDVFHPFDTRTKAAGWIDGYSIAADVVRLAGLFERLVSGELETARFASEYRAASFGLASKPKGSLLWFPSLRFFGHELENQVIRSARHRLVRAGTLLALACRAQGRVPRDQAEARRWLGVREHLMDASRWSPGLELMPRADGCLVLGVRPHGEAGILRDTPDLVTEFEGNPDRFEPRDPYTLLEHASYPGRFAAAPCILAPIDAK